MTHRSFIHTARLRWVAPSVLSLLTPGLASAQVPPPPLPPPAGEEESEGEEDSVPEPDPEPASADTPAPEETPSPETEREPEPWEQPVGTTGTASVEAAGGAAAADDVTPEQWRRQVSTRRQTTIYGSTGLHRVREAGSGAAGTFRINVIGSFFSRNNFLCPENAPCFDEFGDDQGGDRAKRSTVSGFISATPFPFLEAYVGLVNSVTTNSNGTPENILVLGDSYWGLKAFLPDKLDRIYSFGGEFAVNLLTGTGGLSVAGGAANYELHALGTLDLNNRSEPSARIPLRAHLNLGYQFNNSAKIVEDLETTPPPNGRGEPIERTERYGLGISRVDYFKVGLAAEYVHPYIRPFLEYSIDIPVNRQGYVCNRQGAASRGDQCLGDSAGWGTSPNRLTVGVNGFPWQATGLSLKAALDIGTGGTKTFLEETIPEAPWTLWFGMGYVVDTVPPPPKMLAVEAPPSLAEPETRRYITGLIVDEKAGTPIPDAIIRYEGVPMTGLVANAAGEFITQDLPAGEYSFKIFAEEFEEGTCTIEIPADAPELGTPSSEEPLAERGPTEPSDESTADATATEGEESAAAETASVEAPDQPYTDGAGNLLVPAVCKLKELPQLATITGLLVDSETGGPVPDATVTITDHKNRSLSLDVDEVGSFQFRNVPFGPARLHAVAPGYLPTVTPVVVDSRGELKPHVLLNSRPQKLDVRIVGKEIRVDRPLKFVGESTELTIKSTAMLEEIAVFLAENPDAGNVEIQVHTDDSGAASYSRRLSQERADRLQEILIQLGVKEGRLSAKGYGPDQPLSPNVSDANREKNNRVQLMIVKEQN